MMQAGKVYERQNTNMADGGFSGRRSRGRGGQDNRWRSLCFQMAMVLYAGVVTIVFGLCQCTGPQQGMLESGAEPESLAELSEFHWQRLMWHPPHGKGGSLSINHPEGGSVVLRWIRFASPSFVQQH